MKRLRACLVQIILATLVLSLGFVKVSPVHAQDPTDWQASATGLSVAQNDEQKTAGLGFVVQAENWPFLSLRGGVDDGGWYLIGGPIGIELGSIKIPGDGAATLTSETVDWAHNEMTFTSDTASQMRLWVSRLTPAVLVQSPSDSLRLLAGNVGGNVFDGTDITPRPEGPAYPKYVAYMSGGVLQMQTLGPTEIPLALDQNWLLLWYGDNSHFVDTKKPLSYRESLWRDIGKLPVEHAYQADAPLLLVFQNLPQTIKHSEEGGIELSFDNAAGYVTLLPLFGRDHLSVTETEGWPQGLPGEVLQKAQWWAEHLCSYPVGVTETYAYDEGTDRATITESVNFLSVCSGGIQFAPLPPMLGIAKDSLAVSFSGSLVDGNLFTEFGPTFGIENAQEYSWSVSGLEKYIDAKRIITNQGQAPTELEQELESQINKLFDDNGNPIHFSPWLFLDGIPARLNRGDLYWGNSADTIYHLVEAVDAIDDINLRNSLIGYIQSERLAHPPEDVFNLDLTEGTIRGAYSYLDSETLYTWNENATGDNTRQDAFLKDVPLYTFFALARYYDLTQETLPADVWQKAQDTLDRDMREQDWATFYWFDGFDDRRIAVINANRHFAGLVGYVKLAQMAGDAQAEGLGRSLLTKAAVLRLAMAKYPRYLYSANLAELPPEPDWQVRYTAGEWRGYLFNYDWAGPYDDARQVTILDQFGVFLHDHSGSRSWLTGLFSPYLTSYRDLVPELARFLTDFAYEDVEIYMNKVEALFPHWYTAFAEGALGQEHNLSHPINSFQIFMAKALIQGEPPQSLATYIDIPWLYEGDLFYVHKLAETIKAYRGLAWADTVSLNARPGDQTVYLAWSVYTDLPPGLTWQIDYQSLTGTLYTPITGIISPTRAYTLTGLTNYVWYTVTLSGMSGDVALLTSDPVRVMPTDRFIYLPLILKEF